VTASGFHVGYRENPGAGSPAFTGQRLRGLGPGSSAAVGFGRQDAPGHWFNAVHHKGTILAVDGQSAQFEERPPVQGRTRRGDPARRHRRRPQCCASAPARSPTSPAASAETRHCSQAAPAAAQSHQDYPERLLGYSVPPVVTVQVAGRDPAKSFTQLEAVLASAADRARGGGWRLLCWRGRSAGAG
jgi:Papain fold toxin 1, glutamine deamidase